jgi:hypothetical protein
LCRAPHGRRSRAALGCHLGRQRILIDTNDPPRANHQPASDHESSHVARAAARQQKLALVDQAVNHV